MVALVPTVALLVASASGALVGADARIEGEPLPAATPEQLARGEWLMHDFCLACHVLETQGASNPFRPKIRMETFGTPERAYANIGRLSGIRPQMAHAFRGSDSDRRALAYFLSRMAQENRVPWWRVAAPYLALAIGVAAAGSYFLWTRRSRR